MESSKSIPIKSKLLHQSKLCRQSYWASVTLGNPKQECRSFGICKIDYLDKIGKKQPIGNSCIARIRFSIDGKIEICFQKSTLSSALRRKHFSTSYFKIKEPVKKIFGEEMKDVLYLKKGEYKITETEQYFTITNNL